MAEITYPLSLVGIGTANLGQLLALGDSSMPSQGVAAPSELRVQATYYPGTATPSVQIMGTQEGDIVLRGTWRDEWLGLVGGALALMQAARDLHLAQGRLLLTWGPYFVRYGYVRRFTPTIRKNSTIEWELAFLVDQADEAIVLAVPAPNPASVFSLAAVLALVALALEVVATAAIAINNLVNAAE